MASIILKQVLKRSHITTLTSIANMRYSKQIDGKHFTTSTALRVGYQLKDNLADCYNLLNVSEDCNVEELKEAYFKMAKLYHPDSQSSTADSKKFDQIKQAYKTIKQHMEFTAEGKEFEQFTAADVDDDDDDDDEFIFKQQQAQHRQYLDNEGFGIGPRGERQRQYEQMKVSRAQHNLYKYKVKKMMTPEDRETALVDKEKKIAKKQKMSNSMDRLVEDMIQDAMARGDFDNLSGTGKPLDFSKENPHVDKMTQKMNQILLDNDFQPDWIMKNKEIREHVKHCRERLAIERKRLGPPPYTGHDLKAWETYMENFRLSLADINEKVNVFNLSVPMLHRQIMPFSFNRELEKVCANFEEYIPSDYVDSVPLHENVRRDKNISKVTFTDLWKEVMNLFRQRENT